MILMFYLWKCSRTLININIHIGHEKHEKICGGLIAAAGRLEP